MHLNKWLALGAAGALSVGIAACGSDSSSSTSTGGSGSSASATLNGAGSTFAAPLYSEWGNKVKDQGITVNYQPVGSGAGVAGSAVTGTHWCETQAKDGGHSFADAQSSRLVHVARWLFSPPFWNGSQNGG